MKIRRMTELALLTAVAMIIFVIELQIPSPVPIPGVKLGLANIITVYAVYRYRPYEAAAILLSRIVLGSIFGGQILSLLYSLTGGTLCLCGMLGLKHILPKKYLWLCSILGAVLHNIGQIAVAILITRTAGLIVYLPVLLLSGCIAGLFTGLCAQFVVNRKDV